MTHFNPWHDVSRGDETPTVVQSIIEIPKGSKGKYELDKESGLLKLDPGSVQTLMRSVDNETLCRALKGGNERTRAFFMQQMSTRAAKNLTDEMASLGPVRLKEVDEAQAKMTEIAKDLAEKGEIMIAKNSAEEELVY